MKKIAIFMQGMICMLLCGCNSDDSAPIRPADEVMEVLRGNYWLETSYLLRIENGRETVSSTSLMKMKYPDVIPHGPMEHELGLFYFEEDGSIDRYLDSDGSGQDMLVFPASYRCTPSLDGTMLEMKALREIFSAKGWFAGVKLSTRECVEDRIEFDAEINEFSRREWGEWIDANTTAIRTVWKRIPKGDIVAGRYGDLENAEER